MKTAIALAILTLSLAGCMTMGRPFDPNTVRQFKPGVTTRQDAITALGPPSAESDAGRDQTLLQWQYIHGTMFGGSGAHAAILFGSDGKMVNLSHLSQQ